MAEKDEQEKAEKDAEKDDLENREVTSTMTPCIEGMSHLVHRITPYWDITQS